jgi:hypothetical protein
MKAIFPLAGAGWSTVPRGVVGKRFVRASSLSATLDSDDVTHTVGKNSDMCKSAL